MSGSQLATMALKRVDIHNQQDDILQPLIEAGVHLLPNTSGAKMPKTQYLPRLARKLWVPTGSSSRFTQT